MTKEPKFDEYDPTKPGLADRMNNFTVGATEFWDKLEHPVFWGVIIWVVAVALLIAGLVLAITFHITALTIILGIAVGLVGVAGLTAAVSWSVDY